MDPEDWDDSRKSARRESLRASELRFQKAQPNQPDREAEEKLRAIREATSYSFPTGDIDQMLAEIEAGRADLAALLEARRTGRFISLAEGRARTARMIAAKKEKLGAPD